MITPVMKFNPVGDWHGRLIGTKRFGQRFPVLSGPLPGMIATPANSRCNPPLPTLLSLKGNDDFDSEKLIAYELGYRIQPLDQFSIDAATFYNVYDDLQTFEPEEPCLSICPSPYIFQSFIAKNKMNGETYGVELAANWDLLKWWRLRGSYTFLQMQLHIDGNSEATTAESIEKRNPHNQFGLWSFMDLPMNLELNLGLRYMDNLPDLDIDSYVSMDASFIWKPLKDLELAIVGQDLLDTQHPEYVEPLVRGFAEIERSIYGKITWQF